jgi:hypothetical protein
LQKELTGLSAKTKTSLKKCFFIILENCLPKPQKGAKKDSLKNKHDLMLVGKKKHEKTARDIN